MKRLGLIAGILVLLFAVGSFALQGSAQDDAVPILQTQVADLQTRVAALEAASGTPAAGVTVVASSGTAMLFQGTGHQVVDVGRLEGVYVMHVTYASDNRLIPYISLTLTGKQTGHTEMPVTLESPPLDGSFVLNILESAADNYLMEIDAQGDWTITIEPAA